MVASPVDQLLGCGHTLALLSQTGVHPTCTIHRAAMATYGPEWSPLETSDEPGNPVLAGETPFMQVREVVRGGVEPPTFRFSGGLIYRILTWQDVTLPADLGTYRA
jgi:hypothetical protein